MPVHRTSEYLRVIEFFVDNPQHDTIFLPGGLQLLLGYLVKDGLLEIRAKLFPAIAGSIFTNDEYHLTDAGQEFVGLFEVTSHWQT